MDSLQLKQYRAVIEFMLYLEHPLLLFGLQGMDGLSETIERFIADTCREVFGVIQARMHFCHSFQKVHAHHRAQLLQQVYIIQHLAKALALPAPFSTKSKSSTRKTQFKHSHLQRLLIITIISHKPCDNPPLRKAMSNGLFHNTLCADIWLSRDEPRLCS